MRLSNKLFLAGAGALVVLVAVAQSNGIIPRPTDYPDAAPEPVAAAPTAPALPAPEVLRVSANELARAYRDNEVAAQNAYGNKPLLVTGVVSGITLDIFNHPVVQMRGVNEFLPVQARFDDTDKVKLASLQKGQSVTVQCTEITEVISAPMLSSCTLPE